MLGAVSSYDWAPEKPGLGSHGQSPYGEMGSQPGRKPNSSIRGRATGDATATGAALRHVSILNRSIRATRNVCNTPRGCSSTVRFWAILLSDLCHISFLSPRIRATMAVGSVPRGLGVGSVPFW
jgi:hypothetical protein